MTEAFTAHPEICAEALRLKKHWEYAFTALCSARSVNHCGWVTDEAAEAIRAEYGWSASKYYRILTGAEDMGWVHRANGRLYLAGPVRIAKSLGITYLGRNSVLVSAESLKTNRALSAAMLKAFLQDKRNPLSQKYIRLKTGIPERTQRHYLNRCKDVYRIANYIVTTLRPEDVVGARNTDHPGAFVKNGQVIAQSANTYVIQAGSVRPHRVRATRRANSRLRELAKSGQGETRLPRPSRLWYDSDKQFFMAQKSIGRGKRQRRPFYYIKTRDTRALDGRICFQEYDLYVDPLFSPLAG